MRTEDAKGVKLSDYRAPDYRIKTVDLLFQLEPNATRVMAKLAMEKTGSGPLTLNGEALKLIGVKIDGAALDASRYAVGEHSLTIADTPKTFLLEIETEIDPANNTALEGLYMAGSMFCTQCEAEGFRRITYFLDRPDVMAIYTTRIEADKSAYPILLSNGNKIETGELPNGKHFAVWHDPFPKPCYLFALVAGDLGSISDSFTTMTGRKVALEIYVEHGNESKAAYAMDSLKRSMKWDEDAYGREYDLDIFMIVAVSAFNMGAMENKGLNIFNDKLLLASPETATDDDYARIESVVAHEYFHNWTGNRITCRDWFQLSLKEGLTVFRDQGFSADMRSAGVKRIEDVKALRGRQFQEDAGPLAHPVQPQSYIKIDNFYTATIYEKGAEVIGMLKRLVGAEGYRKATDLYFERHDGEAATVEDWVKCFEDACKRDLSQFRLWYLQAGTPVIEAKESHDAANKSYALTLTQSLGATPGQPVKKPMHIPVTIGLLDAAGESLPLTLEGENAKGPDERTLELRETSQTFVFKDIETKPLLSLGRGFSAPAIFKQQMTSEQRAEQMACDTDSFNRWESGNKLATELLLDMTQNAIAGKPFEVDPVYIEAIGGVIERAHEDHAFAALMLTPPFESELAQAAGNPDPEAIHSARILLLETVAAVHGPELSALYKELEPKGGFSTDAASAGRRSLRNVALRFLTVADDERAAELAEAHYRSASNMTDRIAGLGALSRMISPRTDAAFADFFKRFENDPLVLDKWMSLQAGSTREDTVSRVRGLMANKPFDIRNPNRVRALVGAFSANHLRFHGADGAGYSLVGETIKNLDAINPQVAARMASAFESWRRYDSDRQEKMRTQLQRLADGASPNLAEVAGRMLG